MIAMIVSIIAIVILVSNASRGITAYGAARLHEIMLPLLSWPQGPPARQTGPERLDYWLGV